MKINIKIISKRERDPLRKKLLELLEHIEQKDKDSRKDN